MKENICRVTYISDGDIKGSIPDFVKRYVSEGQGSVAGKMNACLKEMRANKKNKGK